MRAVKWEVKNEDGSGCFVVYVARRSRAAGDVQDGVCRAFVLHSSSRANVIARQPQHTAHSPGLEFAAAQRPCDYLAKISVRADRSLTCAFGR
jgi:hypothetical protein